MSRCIVMGCRNEVVREYEHKTAPGVGFGVCAFHGQSIIRWGNDGQVRDYLLPSSHASPPTSGSSTTPADAVRGEG